MPPSPGAKNKTKMIVVLKNNVSPEEENAVVEEIKKLGYRPHVMHGVARTVIGAIGDEHSHRDLDVLNAWPQVESVTPIQKRHKLVSREAHPQDSTVNAGGVIVSYFEWTQNLQEFRWEENRVNEELLKIMDLGYQAVREKAASQSITHRQAAFQIGVERVARAVELRGFV